MLTQNGPGCPAFLVKSAAYEWREGQGKGDVSIHVALFIQGGLSWPRGQKVLGPCGGVVPGDSVLGSRSWCVRPLWEGSI